jgi:hypothetical protein
VSLFLFSDISLQELAENLILDASSQFPAYARDILLEQLGIAQFMETPSCSRSSSLYTPNENGWTKGMFINFI